MSTFKSLTRVPAPLSNNNGSFPIWIRIPGALRSNEGIPQPEPNIVSSINLTLFQFSPSSDNLQRHL